MVNLPHTVTSPIVQQLYDTIHKQLGARVVFGGSVGQTDELAHSYHRSWEDSPHDGGYSVHYFGDRHMLSGKTQYSAALDLTFHAPEDMQRYTARLRHLAESQGPLNWSHGLREFAGTLDSKVVFAMDTTKNIRTYGWDSSHLWHIHLSFNRRLVTSRRLLKLAVVFD